MYKIIFMDGTEFVNNSDDLNNSKWSEIPDKPILSLEYSLLGQTITSSEYEAYNHCVERNFSVLKGTKMISKVIIMLKKDNQVERIIFDLIKKQLYRDIVAFGKEYKDKPVTGWKLGIKVP